MKSAACSPHALENFSNPTDAANRNPSRAHCNARWPNHKQDVNAKLVLRLAVSRRRTISFSSRPQAYSRETNHH